jgi:hypothetical protein
MAVGSGSYQLPGDHRSARIWLGVLGPMSAIVAGQSTRPKALLQHLHQHRCRICLPFSRYVFGKYVYRALDQHSQDSVRIRLALADHADHLGENVLWVRSAGGNALYPTDQLIHGSKRTLRQCASIAGPGALMQP